MNKYNRISERSSALIAGISLLLMALVAGLTYGYIHGSLVIPGNAEETLNNISGSIGLFQSEIAGWTLTFLLDALVAWSLYHFFAGTSRGLSALSSVLRVVYTVFLGIAIFNLPKVLAIINDHMAEYGVEGASSKLMHYLNSFETIWSYGLIVFGLHLMVLGYLALRSSFVPKLWGILLIIAGVCYSGLNVLYAIAPGISENISSIEAIMAIPMTIGELAFAFWLIIKGGRGK